jgi:ankyrin repeat protein
VTPSTSIEVDPRWHAFRDAVHERRFDDAESMLSETPALLSLTSGLGETALHYLAVEDDVEGVAWLKAKGADLDTKNRFGTPVLFEVAQLEYRQLHGWLVQNGADTGAQDRDGRGIVEHLLQFEVPEMIEWVRKGGA